MSLIRKHGAVLQAWACLALVLNTITQKFAAKLKFREGQFSAALWG